jgi:menaquinone-specific isochorismate synthase
MELIRQLEPTDRGSYAGPIGWVGADGDGEWVIALRGAVLTDGKIIAHAGCGIVNGSSPEAELAETRLKFKPIRQVLGLNADQR